jgi:CBS-domain-containing membrane protein
MWNFLFAFLSARAVVRSRFLRLTLLFVLFGALIAGLIYAAVVFNAVTERSHPSHVHPHTSN